MRVTIPLTGTVLAYDPITGDPDDPIRPIGLRLGNVSWELVELNLDDDTMVIEVTPSPEVSEPTGQVDADGRPVYRRRPTTEKERQAYLGNIQELIHGHTREELYSLSKSKRLSKPFSGAP